MKLRNLGGGEFVAMAGGLLLIVSLFLPWYNLLNRQASLPNIKHVSGGTATAWQALPGVPFALLIVGVAPFVLAYIVLRGHELSWDRGEVTALLGLIILILIFFVGFIIKPGDPDTEIGRSLGYWLSILATFLIIGGSLMLQYRQFDPAARKPPGEL